MNRSRGKAREIAILGIFTAILILQSFVPFLGYIPLLPGMPVITLMVMTVMVGAVMLGPKDGALLGLIWGVTSLIRAYTMPGTVTFLLFANPVIAIVPRFLVGWLTGLGASWLRKLKTPQAVSYGLIGFFGAALNTFTVIALSSLFYLNQSSTLLSQLGYQGDSRNLFVILLTVLGVNGLAEAISALFIVPLLGIPLIHVWQRRQS